MNDAKPFYKSKTVVSALLAMLVVVLPVVGVNFTADDSALISQGVDKIIEFLLLTTALYGRVTASQQIGA